MRSSYTAKGWSSSGWVGARMTHFRLRNPIWLTSFHQQGFRLLNRTGIIPLQITWYIPSVGTTCELLIICVLLETQADYPTLKWLFLIAWHPFCLNISSQGATNLGPTPVLHRLKSHPSFISLSYCLPIVFHSHKTQFGSFIQLPQSLLVQPLCWSINDTAPRLPFTLYFSTTS